MSMANMYLGRGDGVCHCKECESTPEKQIEQLQKRVRTLEKERDSKYSELRKYFDETKNREVKESVKAIKFTNKEKAKLKKFVKGSMSKKKLEWVMKIWLEVDSQEFMEVFRDYEE